jgi:hypothetical protein
MRSPRKGTWRKSGNDFVLFHSLSALSFRKVQESRPDVFFTSLSLYNFLSVPRAATDEKSVSLKHVKITSNPGVCNWESVFEGALNQCFQ